MSKKRTYKSIQELVRAVLDAHPEAKNNYNEMVLRTWRACGAKVPDQLINYAKWHCPSPETVSRVHRELKKESKIIQTPEGSKLVYPYRPDPDVLAARKSRQIAMTEMFRKKKGGDRQ